MQIIEHRQTIETITHSHFFEWKDCPGAGFGFDCDEKGNVDLSTMCTEAIENLSNCLRDVSEPDGKLIDRGIQTYHGRYTTPAIGLCEVCGRRVELDGFTCTCECGADYNSSGQRLAPRSQWGEETGESLSDILRIK